MRPIHVAQLDKARPVLVLTRSMVQPHLARITVAVITTTVRGLSTEVPVGPENGLDVAGVVSCDNIVTIPKDSIGRQLGFLLEAQEPALAEAICTAFDFL